LKLIFIYKKKICVSVAHIKLAVVLLRRHIKVYNRVLLSVDSVYVTSYEDFYQPVTQGLASKRQQAINFESLWTSSVSSLFEFKSQASLPSWRNVSCRLAADPSGILIRY
jgi:hypothetical protein